MIGTMFDAFALRYKNQFVYHSRDDSNGQAAPIVVALLLVTRSRQVPRENAVILCEQLTIISLCNGFTPAFVSISKR